MSSRVKMLAQLPQPWTRASECRRELEDSHGRSIQPRQPMPAPPHEAHQWIFCTCCCATCAVSGRCLPSRSTASCPSRLTT